MIDKLLEEIKSRGYWRINFRPITYTQRIPNLATCHELVAKNSVEKRGWDYPHVPQKQDTDTGIARRQNHVEGWVDWSGYKEIWRMYESGQFIHYKAMKDDWRQLDERTTWNRRPSGDWISPIDLNWHISEVFEFLSRLRNDIYADGVQISIEMYKTSGRELWMNDPSRVPFSRPKICAAEEIKYSKSLSPLEIQNQRVESVKAIQMIYDRFNWNPTDEMVEGLQNELYQFSERRR